MIELFLALNLSCSDINKITQRVILNEYVTQEQKKEIVFELSKVTPNCKIEVKF